MLIYSKVIEYIKEIVYYKVPIEKLTKIALKNLSITKCVDEFWKKWKKFAKIIFKYRWGLYYL